MVVLKKIRSATLVEAIVATALIVIIFVVASLVLNNLLINSFKKNTHNADCRVKELLYLAKNSEIQLPYSENFGKWDIKLVKGYTEKGEQNIMATAVKEDITIKQSRLCAPEN